MRQGEGMPMARALLLLGLMLGIAAAANAAHALALLDAGRSVAQSPDPAFAPVNFKRHGLHRGSGRVHKRFGSPRSFAGKRWGHHGVVVRKGFVDPRFVARKSFRPRGVSIKERFVDLRQFSGKSFRHGVFDVRKRQLFWSKRFGHGHSTVAKGSGGPQFLRKRFKHRHVVIDEPRLRPQLSAGAGFGNHSVVITNGLVLQKIFRGKRFGKSDVLVGKGFAGKPIRHRTWGRPLHRGHR
jgi:hypothetical protein